MEISFSFNSITGDYIDTKFGTCHDSSAVLPCAKFGSDPFISTVKPVCNDHLYNKIYYL